MKDDGSLIYRGEVTPLMKLFLRRRSVRKYAEGKATAAQLDYLQRCVALFQERSGCDTARLSLVARGPDFDAVVRAAMGGIIGKVNPWLAFTRASHLLLAGARYDETSTPDEVERAIKQAAMTMQVAVLAATEQGLATCWLAGINHERVESAFALPDGARLIAISPLGAPPRKMGLSWDALLYHLTAKRRKPLADLWMEERWRS